MRGCNRIRPLLYNIVEGESTPEEAIEVGRHLTSCTACKILLARKRRLGEILEHGLEDFPVGEEFVQSVMATLPDGPPPTSSRKAKHANWHGVVRRGSSG